MDFPPEWQCPSLEEFEGWYNIEAERDDGYPVLKSTFDVPEFSYAELHHLPSQRNGGLFDVVSVWPDEHAIIDPFRRMGASSMPSFQEKSLNQKGNRSSTRRTSW